MVGKNGESTPRPIVSFEGNPFRSIPNTLGDSLLSTSKLSLTGISFLDGAIGNATHPGLGNEPVWFPEYRKP